MKRQKNETSNSKTLGTRTKLPSQNLLNGTTSHDRTVEYRIILAIEASGQTVGHYFEMFDPGKNGFQLTGESTSKLNYEFALDKLYDNFMYISLPDNDVEKATEVCSLETYLVQDTNESDEVITITEARHTQRRSRGKFDLVLYKKDLAFSGNHSKMPERLTHKHASGAPHILFSDILGTIIEHLHL